MDNEVYFRSMTDEINGVKNRVRDWLGKQWPSDGAWKESVLRAILRRHLPETVGIGTGYIVNPTKHSSQVDILLYDKTKPVVFQDGEFVIVTKDSTLGFIEVKTTASKYKLKRTFDKLADNIQLASYGGARNQFFGIFFSNNTIPGLDNKRVQDYVLKSLFLAAKQSSHRIINCVSIGEEFFIQYWMMEPGTSRSVEKWHAYRHAGMAPTFFIHNVIELLFPESVGSRNSVWFPRAGIEKWKVSERQLREGNSSRV